MTKFARVLMRSKRARRCVYTAPGASVGVPAGAVLDDSSAEARLRNGREVLGDGPEASVLESLGAVPGGVLDFNGTIYRIETIEPSTAPGLSDCLLTRVSGPALDEFDLSRGIIKALREDITLDGRPVKAAVTRRSVALEYDSYGQPIRATRTLFSVAKKDVQGSKEGAVIVFNSKTYHAARFIRSGASLTTFVC